MVVGGCSRVVLQEEVQVADLVENDGAVNEPWTVDLVQLLDCEFFVEVEAEHRVKLFTVLSQASDQQDLGRRDLDRCESPYR